MSTFNIKEHTHKRLNLLTGEWVLVSPHRTKRPWQGKVETHLADERPEYDKTCYLCPGNSRADGSVNPEYTKPYVFNNDFAALIDSTPDGHITIDDMLFAKSQKGICKVLCFSPKHNLTLPLMELSDIVEVVKLWQDEFKELSSQSWIKYIQIFENKGDIMGCSNPHPHGQIWSLSDIPTELAKESKQQQLYFAKNNKSLLADYLKVELKDKERIVYENEHFVALVPFWAVWPFEIMIISRRHVTDITQFNEAETQALAQIIKIVTIKYDNLFSVSFPYSAGMHQRPVNDGIHEEWHWHMHFYPPLLRSATVKKFMVGYEMLASPQRDITPEWAAEKLRTQDEMHYKLYE